MTVLVSDRPVSAPTPEPRFPRPQQVGRGLAVDMPGQGYGVLGVVLDAGTVTEPAGAWGATQLLADLFGHGSAGKSAEQVAIALETLGARTFAGAGVETVHVGAYAPVGVLDEVAALVAEALWSPDLVASELEAARGSRLAGFESQRTHPGSLAGQAMRRSLWAADCRLVAGTDGTPESVAALTREALLEVHASTWTPRRATPLLAGDLSGLDTSAVLQRLVPDLSEPTTWDDWAPSALAAARRVVLVDRPGSVQSQLYVAHVSSGVTDDFDIPDSIVSRALGGSFGSRLNSELRERRGVTYGVGAGFNRGPSYGSFFISTQVRTDATVESLQEIHRQVALMQAEGPTAEELEEARGAMLSGPVMGFRSAEAVEGAMSAWLAHRRPLDVEQRKHALTQRITLDEVRAAAAASLRPQDLVTVVVGDAASFGAALADAGLGPVETVDPA